MKRTLLLQLYSALVWRNLSCSTMTGTMRAVRLKEMGVPSEMYVKTDEPIPELASKHDVLLRVAATALNRADTLQRRGLYNPPKGASDIIGLEASGVIEAVGESVKDFK